MSQSHGSSAFREPAGSGGVPSVTSLRIVLLSGTTYQLAATGGPTAGSFVQDGSGGHKLTPGDLTGDTAVIVSGKMLFY